MGKDGLHGSCGKKALHRQIFVVGYVQFVDLKHLHAALCSNGYGTSAVARQTAQVAVHEWHRNNAKHWFREATWKIPRRWQCCITEEGDILS